MIKLIFIININLILIKNTKKEMELLLYIDIYISVLLPRVIASVLSALDQNLIPWYFASDKCCIYLLCLGSKYCSLTFCLQSVQYLCSIPNLIFAS